MYCIMYRIVAPVGKCIIAALLNKYFQLNHQVYSLEMHQHPGINPSNNFDCTLPASFTKKLPCVIHTETGVLGARLEFPL